MKNTLVSTAGGGLGGFGYDPLFYLLEFDPNMADLDINVKFAIGHCALPFADLLPRLAL